ncbi:phosphoribosyl-AMP cyclohydrolase [Altererythrobacter aquiaggeris]|uniref:phosphoribosyl-AMP cyclohydrolase n=1 Tax=Aestuarierythrobacter aquiaggeris TaxID=1898396 RepID=UPI003018ACED
MPKEDNNLRERGSAFLPKFGSDGLLTAVVIERESNRPLMVAHMNAEALSRSRETGIAHFYSRSRQALWMKGETSGNILTIERIFVDCDQDALVLVCVPAGPACHTGAFSCFYRELVGDELTPNFD